MCRIHVVVPARERVRKCGIGLLFVEVWCSVLSVDIVMTHTSSLSCSAGQGAIPSSDVAKVIGMLLQIGMEQLDQLVTVPGVVEVSLGDQDGEGVVVEAAGVDGEIKIPLKLYCDDGGKAFEGSALSLQSSLDNFSIMLCMFRMTFKASSVGVRGPECLVEETYMAFGVGLQGGVESVTIRTIVKDVAGARLLGSDIRARLLWGGGGGGSRHRAVSVMVGWIMGGGFGVEEVRRLVQSVVVPRVTFGVCLSGVTPHIMLRSDRVLSTVGRLVGLDRTCAASIVFAREIHGGMGFVTLTVETLCTGAREFNVVYCGASAVRRRLWLKERMWRQMVCWCSHQYVESKDSMVVTLFELFATYGVQVCMWRSLRRFFIVLCM